MEHWKGGPVTRPQTPSGPCPIMPTSVKVAPEAWRVITTAAPGCITEPFAGEVIWSDVCACSRAAGAQKLTTIHVARINHRHDRRFITFPFKNFGRHMNGLASAPTNSDVNWIFIEKDQFCGAW